MGTLAEVLQQGGDATASAEKSEGAIPSEPETQDFLQGFIRSFEEAVGSDETFSKTITSLMTSFLPNDLICQPLQQLATCLEQWIKQQKHLSTEEEARYKGQIELYSKLVKIYQSNPDPLPEAMREEVQKCLAELHNLGQPPDQVLKEIAPKETEVEGDSFEDFMKSMGFADGLSKADQDVLHKLADDPQELTQVLKEMARKVESDGPNAEACAQQ